MYYQRNFWGAPWGGWERAASTGNARPWARAAHSRPRAGGAKALGAVVLKARPHNTPGRGVGLGRPHMNFNANGARSRATTSQAGAQDITLSYANPSGRASGCESNFA